MVRQIVFAALLISAVFGYPLENEQEEGKGYIQQMLESAGLYQGDIMLTEEQELMIKMKTGILDERLRWPSRVIPYEITAGHFCMYLKILLLKIIVLIKNLLNTFSTI